MFDHNDLPPGFIELVPRYVDKIQYFRSIKEEWGRQTGVHAEKTALYCEEEMTRYRNYLHDLGYDETGRELAGQGKPSNR